MGIVIQTGTGQDQGNQENVMTTEQLVIAYAQNRMQFRRASDAVSELAWKEKDNKALIDELQECRKSWLGIDEKGLCDDEYYQGEYEWKGWVSCAEEAGYEENDDEYKLAVLLEEKKAIRNQAGHIKRAICSRGKQLMKAM